MTKLGSRKLHICPKVTKVGSINGHRIDYNGVGALPLPSGPTEQVWFIGPSNSAVSFLLLLFFFFTQERLKININRWVVMFIIGFITGLIAFSIDCLIIIIADQKYSLIKECILFILILLPVALHQQNLTIMELRNGTWSIERNVKNPLYWK